MNINQLGKIFNDKQNHEVRTLELRVGQVVRGVVTQQLPNQEALVNINGVQVKAKLEVPIMEGQATLMEVAPDSKDGFIHLKQVDSAKAGLHDPMKDILKAMQLPNKDWSNQLVRQLRQDGFPLNRDTLQAFAQAVKLAPPNVDLEVWMQSATLAFKRGMPMTLTSIAAMHQITHGQPIHQLVNQLQQQLAQLLNSQGPQLSQQSSQLVQQLSQSLAQLMSSNQVEANTQPQTQQQQQLAPQAGQAASSQAAGQGQAQGNQGAIVHGQSMQQASQANMMQNPIVSFMKLLGVQHENVLGQQIIQKGEIVASPLHSQAANQTGSAQTPQGPSNQLAGQQQMMQLQSSNVQSSGQQIVANQQASSQQAIPTAPLPSQASLMGQSIAAEQPLAQQSSQQSLQQVGNSQPSMQQLSATLQATSQEQAQPTQVTNQASIVQQAQTNVTNQQNVEQLVQNNANGQGAREASLSPQVNQAAVIHSSESIKATVLLALQMSDIPPAVKESMSQLVNHITGQQMMLSTERNHSMFTHLTMYIPIKDESGEQTAAVHVQTRRDRKGQLDAENCRIVFDLNMKQLGQTLVDMNVVNKIVTINVWNDASYIQPLIDTMRPEIVEAMQKTGYSLSSIKTSSFKQNEQLELNEVKTIITPPDVQQINVSRYKGVDIKV